MELKQAIAQRRSIRKFEDKDVSQQDVMALLESARLCQSACNRQPWRFMVLRDERKNAVVRAMMEWIRLNPGKGDASAFTARVMRNAPVLIMVLREKDDFWKHFDELSIGAAMEHICLTAVDLGLGALWIGHTAYAEKDILQGLGLENMELPGVIAVGWPAEEPGMRPRLEMADILLEPIE